MWLTCILIAISVWCAKWLWHAYQAWEGNVTKAVIQMSCADTEYFLLTMDVAIVFKKGLVHSAWAITHFCLAEQIPPPLVFSLLCGDPLVLLLLQVVSVCNSLVHFSFVRLWSHLPLFYMTSYLTFVGLASYCFVDHTLWTVLTKSQRGLNSYRKENYFSYSTE